MTPVNRPAALTTMIPDEHRTTSRLRSLASRIRPLPALPTRAPAPPLESTAPPPQPGEPFAEPAAEDFDDVADFGPVPLDERLRALESRLSEALSRVRQARYHPGHPGRLPPDIVDQAEREAAAVNDDPRPAVVEDET